MPTVTPPHVCSTDPELTARPAQRGGRRRVARDPGRPAEPGLRVIKPPPLKALYSTVELARAMGISKYFTFKLIRALDILVYRLPGKTLVPATEIRDKLGPLWDAICEADAQRSDAAESEKPDLGPHPGPGAPETLAGPARARKRR